MLGLLREEADAAVSNLVNVLRREAPLEFSSTVEAITALLLRQSKRIRPCLCLLAHDAAGGARLESRMGAREFAASLELLHVFMLIHDDIADRTETRRGGPALHVMLRPAILTASREERVRLGEQLAVVAGDWLYTRALRSMLEAPGLDPRFRSKAVLLVLEICGATAEGQSSDIALSARSFPEVTSAQVLAMYCQKTGRYTFEAPLLAGALLAGASEAACDALRACANHLGVAFQLEDDLLGLFASQQETGKPALSDLAEGKKTWLLLQTRERGGARDRQWIDRLLCSRHATAADLDRVRELVRGTGTLRLTTEEVRRRCAAARFALDRPAAAPWREPLAPLISWIEGRVDMSLREAA